MKQRIHNVFGYLDNEAEALLQRTFQDDVPSGSDVQPAVGTADSPRNQGSDTSDSVRNLLTSHGYFFIQYHGVLYSTHKIKSRNWMLLDNSDTLYSFLDIFSVIF